jgi:hypothetical protein
VVNLSGTASGTYRAGGAGSFNFSGKGTVSPLGRATVKGSLLMPTGQMTIATRHGKVFANLSTTGLSTTVLNTSVSYTITGGTGQFAGASGTGAGFLSISPAHGKGAAHGRFVISLQAAT